MKTNARTDQTPFRTVRLGAVYLIRPERGPDRVRADLETVRAAGFNTIVVWPPVALWENDYAGEPTFGPIDAALDICDELGIGVIIELLGQVECGEYLPHHRFDDDLWVVGQNAEKRNARLVNYNHPRIMGWMDEYLARVVAHHRARRCVIGYDVFNEIRFYSEDPYTEAAFQRWLEQKYVTITALNRAWETYYRAFDQVRFRSLHEGSWWNVTPLADKGRFHAANLEAHLQRWSAIVRRHDPGRPVIIDQGYTATLGDAEIRSDDDFMAARVADVPGLSFYPNSWGDAFWKRPAMISANYAVTLSAAAGKPVILSELQAHCEKLFSADSCVRPRQLYLWSVLALLQGMRGIIYWKWDPFRSGHQFGGRGLVDSEGRPTPRLEALRPLAEHLASSDACLERIVADDPPVAMLYDRQNELFLNRFTETHIAADKTLRNLRMDSHYGWYQFFYDRGIFPAFVNPDLLETRLDKLRVLVVSAQVLLTDRLDRLLRAFLAKGGTLIIEPRFGLMTEHNRMFDTCPGLGWDRLLGLKDADLAPIAADETGVSDCYQVLKDIRPDHEILLRTGGGADRPLCYRIRCGAGQALYFTSFAGKAYVGNPDALAPLAPLLDAARASGDPSALRLTAVRKPSRALAALRRTGSGETLLCLLNFDLCPATLAVAFDQPVAGLEQVFGDPVAPASGPEGHAFDLPAESVCVFKVSEIFMTSIGS